MSAARGAAAAGGARHRLASLIRKEFVQIRRDRRTLAMMVMIPVMWLVVFGYAATRGLRPAGADAGRQPRIRGEARGAAGHLRRGGAGGVRRRLGRLFTLLREKFGASLAGHTVRVDPEHAP